jgi:hypothetical protein
MGYNDRNRLQRIVDIQNITILYKNKGENQEWIYNNIIEPTYRISRGTYYRYLSTPAKLALSKKDPRAFLRKYTKAVEGNFDN